MANRRRARAPAVLAALAIIAVVIAWNAGRIFAKVLDLRYTGRIPMEHWRERMPDQMAKFIIQLAKGLDERGVFGFALGEGAGVDFLRRHAGLVPASTGRQARTSVGEVCACGTVDPGTRPG